MSTWGEAVPTEASERDGHAIVTDGKYGWALEAPVLRCGVKLHGSIEKSLPEHSGKKGMNKGRSE